jgi:hypothetical protein
MMGERAASHHLPNYYIELAVLPALVFPSFCTAKVHVLQLCSSVACGTAAGTGYTHW